MNIDEFFALEAKANETFLRIPEWAQAERMEQAVPQGQIWNMK